MPKLFSSNRRLIFAASLVLVVLLFLSSGIRELTIRILSFPLRTWSAAGNYLQSKHALLDENRDLRKTAGDLSLKLGRLEELQKENERLRELLIFKKKIYFNTVSAEVIATNPNEWIGSFIIDKGTGDGIRKDSAVCSSQGLLGRVVDPGEHTSSVMLVTHPGFKAGGMIKENRVNGLVVGSGKGQVRMIYLPVEAEVEEGMIVITSGFSRMFPKGITIGKIQSVGKSKTGLYKYAIIIPSANPFDQEEVLCIK